MRAGRRLEDLILQGRWFVLAVVAVVTAVAAVAYGRLPVENNIEAWFSTDDPAYVRYRVFRDRFASEETVFVVVHAPDVFERDVLARVDRLTRILESLPRVTHVVSLTNIEDIQGSAEEIRIDPLVPRVDLGADGLAALRRRVLDDPFYPGTVVSRDGGTTVVVAEVMRGTGADDAALVDAVDGAMAATAVPGVDTRLAGWLTVNVLMDRLTQRDVAYGFPFSLGVLGLCVYGFFRSIRVVLIVLVAVVLSVCWTMGAFSALGFTGTALTVSALPGMMLALTIAEAVHVVAEFREARVAHADPLTAMRVALPRVALPVALTAATTAIGFGSEVVAYLAPVRHLGLFAALGMLFTCIICLTVVPIAVVAFPPPRVARPNPRLERGLAWLAGFAHRRRVAIIAASVGLALFGGFGLVQLKPQGTNLNYLPDDSAPVDAMRFIEKHFGGGSTLDIVVEGAPDVVKDPATVATVVALEELLDSYSSTTGTIAYTDLLRRMNQALHDGDRAFYRIPETRAGIAQELLLYETSGGEELGTFLDVNQYDGARVRAFTTSFMGIEENARFFDEVNARLPGLRPPGAPPLRLEITGDWPLWLEMNLSLMDTMVESFALSFVGITAMMALLVRSLWFGLVAMIPNVLPVLLAMGTLGWMGVELDFATVMIAGIALGIAVDDTVHYLTYFRRELAASGDPVEATRRVHTTVGKAIVATGVILFVGLGSMATSGFPPHRTFGVVIALTMAVALAGDLVLLPALLHYVRATPAAARRS